MYRVLIFILILFSLVGCVQQISTEEIAKKLKERYESIKDMSGKIVITTEIDEMKFTRHVNFSIKMPDKYRSEDENAIVVSNGSVVWIYDKRLNEVRILKLQKAKKPEFDYGRFIEDMMEEFNVEYLGTGRVGDRNCYILKLTPKKWNALVDYYKLWIDDEFWYPIKIETIGRGLKITLKYEEIEFNTGLSDEVFEFKIPSSAKVVKVKFPKKLTIEEAQKRVNFTILKPNYTAGYEFSYAVVFKDCVFLIYERGSKSLVVSEYLAKGKRLPNSKGVEIDGISGETSEVFKVKILKFEIEIDNKTLTVEISGDLSEEELVEIAESMIQTFPLDSP